MTGLFGFQAGQRLAEKDKLDQQLAELSIQQGQQQLKRGEVAIQKDQVDLENARVTQARQTEFLKLLKESQGSGEGGTAGTPAEGKDLAGRLEELAEASMTAGLPEQAADYASKAASIKNNNSLIKSRENDERNRRLNYAAGLLDGVQDEQSWKQANMLYTVEFGEESPFAKLDFSPELVQQIKDSVTTQRQKSLIEAANLKAESADEQLAKIKSQTDLNRARKKQVEVRTTNLEKTGDKTTVAKPGDTKVISDMIKSKFGSGSNEEINGIALPIAERMLQLQKELNLPRSEAAARAFKEAEDGGDFGGLRVKRKPPGTKENPLSLPAKQTEWKVNMYYTIKDGEHAGKKVLWTGKEFQVVDDKEVEE